MDWSKLGWFLLGTFAGWLVIFLVITFGGVALSVVIGLAPLLIPLFAVIGIIAVIGWIVKDDRR